MQMRSENGKAPVGGTTEASSVNNPNQKGINMSDSKAASAVRAITVPFLGVDLYVVEHNGQPFTPMRPIVEGMGLTWPSQFRKLAANKERWGISVMETPLQGVSDLETPAGGVQKMLAMPLRKLPGWLATIEPGKVKSQEARAKVVAYQNECDDVLWKYWNDGIAINPRAPYSVNPGDVLNKEEADALRQMIEGMAKKLSADTKVQGRFIMQAWSKLKSHFKVSYREIPRLELTEAISIINRHTLEWELVDEAPKPASASQALATDLTRTKAAFDAAAKAGAAVQGAVFNAVLSGNDEWKLGRWLLAFVDGGAKGAYVQPMERDAFVTTWPRLVKDVDGGACLCSSAELLDMASACMHRLQQRDRKPASHGAFSLTGVIHA